MTSTLKFTGIVTALFITIFALAYFLSVRPAFGSGGQLPALISSSTVFAVSSSPAVQIATSSCTSRIISTASSSIMIQMTEKNGGAPNAAKGFWQGASTTVAYDASLYGCSAWQIYSFATQQITFAEAGQ